MSLWLAGRMAAVPGPLCARAGGTLACKQCMGEPQVCIQHCPKGFRGLHRVASKGILMFALHVPGLALIPWQFFFSYGVCIAGQLSSA